MNLNMKSIPKIYADFNNIEDFENDSFCYLNLTGYGTLASLSNNQIRLMEGMKFHFYDDCGTAVIAHVFFYRNLVNNYCSGWFAKFRKEDIFYEPVVEHNFSIHLCSRCRRNIYLDLDHTIGREYKGACTHCGELVMSPLFPP